MHQLQLSGTVISMVEALIQQAKDSHVASIFMWQTRCAEIALM